MRKSLTLMLSLIICSAPLRAQGLANNTIVLERPQFNCANALSTNDEALVRVYAPFSGPRVLCYHLTNPLRGDTPGPWEGFMVSNATIGVPRDVSEFPAPSSTANPTGCYSYTESIDASEIVSARRVWASTTGVITWTADRNYEFLALSAEYDDANLRDIALELIPVKGSLAELLVSELDCHTADGPGQSPFHPLGYGLKRLGNQMLVTVAKNIKAGDRLTIRRAATGNGDWYYFSGIVAWNRTAADPLTPGAQHLVPTLIAPGQPGLDPAAVTLRPLREAPDDLMYLPMQKTGKELRYWSCGEEARYPGFPPGEMTTHSMYGADGTAATKPTIVWTYFDDTYPSGAVWNPTPGEKRLARAVRIVTTGTVVMWGLIVGHIVIVQEITASGVHQHWRMTFDGDLTGDPYCVQGLVSQWRVVGGAGFIFNPGTLARTPLVRDDDQDFASTQGKRLFMAGGTFGDICLEFETEATDFQAGGALAVSQKVDQTNKFYSYCAASPAAPMYVTPGMIWEGGSRVTMFPRADLLEIYGPVKVNMSSSLSN
jgi:hypothetical protein